MNRLTLAALVIAALTGASAIGYLLGKGASALPTSSKAGAPGGPPPATPVEVARVVAVQLPLGIQAVGSLRSNEAITLRPEIAGRVHEILFKDGQSVTAGQVLVRLDGSVPQAELQQARANLTLNQSKYERALDLQKKGFISSQARDEAESNLKVSQAILELASARLAKLELSAPFAGIVGLRQISLGAYVKDGQDIVNLEAIDPLKVDFRVPEIHLRQVAVGQDLNITLDAFPGRNFKGTVMAINPLVDAEGRAVVVRAVVRNQSSQLRPGMFARVRLMVDDKQDSLVIPEQALLPAGSDLFVFKVVDNRVQRIRVDIGQRRDAKVEILKGLDAGDTVVTAGQLKIRDGAAVSTTLVDTDVAVKPATSLQPSPLQKGAAAVTLAR